MEINRFEVYLIDLEPTVGAEMKKTRPGLIISPDEMNNSIRTIIIAPMTTKIRDYPTRLTTFFDNKHAQIVLDQIRTVDKSRLIKKMGRIDKKTQEQVLSILIKMFSK